MRNSYDSLGVLVVSEVLSYGPVLAIQNQSFASVLKLQITCILVTIWLLLPKLLEFVRMPSIYIFCSHPGKFYRFVTPGCTAFCFSAVVRYLVWTFYSRYSWTLFFLQCYFCDFEMHLFTSSSLSALIHWDKRVNFTDINQCRILSAVDFTKSLVSLSCP